MDNVYFTRHSKKPVEVSNRKRLAAFTLHSGVEPSCLAKSDIVIDLIDYKCFFYDCWGESSGTTFQDAMEPPWPRLFSGSTLTLNVVFEAFIYRFIIFILKKDEGMEAGGGRGLNSDLRVTFRFIGTAPPRTGLLEHVLQTFWPGVSGFVAFCSVSVTHRSYRPRIWWNLIAPSTELG